eukprot:6111899-Amphidinium_carterae.1
MVEALPLTMLKWFLAHGSWLMQGGSLHGWPPALHTMPIDSKVLEFNKIYSLNENCNEYQ